jgi:hypothetical protein
MNGFMDEYVYTKDIPHQNIIFPEDSSYEKNKTRRELLKLR